MREELRKAKELAENEPDEALRLCSQVLNQEFDSMDGQIALFMSGYLMMQAERYGIAYHIFQRCAQLRPNQSEVYSNMGMCLEEADPDRAIELFETAYQLDKKNISAIANKALMYLQTGRPKQCISLCNHALELDPNLRSAVHNRGLARLMLGDWGGWEDYHDTLGVKHREKRNYDLPDWNGEPGKVLVYGEQGVGDEIMFSSCLPDLLKTNEIVFDCDSRLESLFKRSFDFPIYGTRYHDSAPWVEDEKPAYQCAIGQLPYFYRRKSEDYPGKPYINCDPERKAQWDCLLSKDKPRIGIAWSGGLSSTGKKNRTTTPEMFEPLFSLDAEFVNLDYKPYDGDLPIKNWPRAVLKGVDLEETLALVANLDLVITVCTSLVYFAGSQGIKTWVMVPPRPGYRYGIKGEKFDWYDSVKLYRGTFEQSIKRIRKDAEDLYRLRGKGNDSLPRIGALNNKAS